MLIDPLRLDSLSSDQALETRLFVGAAIIAHPLQTGNRDISITAARKDTKPGNVTREKPHKWVRQVAPPLIWLTLALLSTTQLYSIYRLENRDASLWRIAFWQSSAWLLWALLTPGVLWLGRRYRLERANWRRVALIHLSASVSFAALHLVLQALSRYWTPLSLEPRLTLQ
jgi:hypothetical protein